MEMVTQKFHVNFKLKVYLNDGSNMNRCYCSRAQKTNMKKNTLTTQSYNSHSTTHSFQSRAIRSGLCLENTSIWSSLLLHRHMWSAAALFILKSEHFLWW